MQSDSGGSAHEACSFIDARMLPPSHIKNNMPARRFPYVMLHTSDHICAVITNMIKTHKGRPADSLSTNTCTCHRERVHTHRLKQHGGVTFRRLSVVRLFACVRACVQVCQTHFASIRAPACRLTGGRRGERGRRRRKRRWRRRRRRRKRYWRSLSRKASGHHASTISSSLGDPRRSPRLPLSPRPLILPSPCICFPPCTPRHKHTLTAVSKPRLFLSASIFSSSQRVCPCSQDISSACRRGAGCRLWAPLVKMVNRHTSFCSPVVLRALGTRRSQTFAFSSTATISGSAEALV